MTMGRRAFLAATMAGVAAGAYGIALETPSMTATRRRPLIDITDLYHPAQDPGDNFDLVSAYALPEVDLKAVLFDVTERYRRPYTNEQRMYEDPTGRRDAGFIPVTQLNAIFDRHVPCAVCPYEAMRSPDDPMTDAPAFQQQGIDLMLRVLQESDEPVEVLSFGSARPLAVALNRAPKLLRDKIGRVHLCAGTAPAGYVEWNVQLDPHAFVRVMRSDLPIALYPCATPQGPFDVGPFNCFWKLPDMSFIREMAPALRRYLVYAFEASTRMDFLVAMEDEPAKEALDRACARAHNVWETAVWIEAADRKLVRRADGRACIVPRNEVASGDVLDSGRLAPCTWTVDDHGNLEFSLTDHAPRSWIYHRERPQENELALREALPDLYCGYKPPARGIVA